MPDVRVVEKPSFSDEVAAGWTSWELDVMELFTFDMFS
jgi:hypothetical protein